VGKKLVWPLITLISFTLATFSIQLLFKRWDQTAIIMVSLLAHELGHMAAFAVYGVTCHLIAIPFLGAGAIPTDQKAFAGFSDFRKSVAVLAGPVVNLVLMFAGFAIAGSDRPLGLTIAGINASLAAFNLLPISITDGGRFAKALFASLNEENDLKVALTASVLALIMALSLGLAGKFVYFPILLAIFFQRGAKQDNPRETYAPGAMNLKTATVMLAVYTVTLVPAYLATIFLPNWRGL